MRKTGKLVVRFGAVMAIVAAAVTVTGAGPAQARGGIWRLFNESSGGCIVGSGYVDNTPVTRWSGCREHNYADQWWEVLEMPNGYFRITSTHNGMCLTSPNDSLNATIRQAQCNGSDRQQWKLIKEYPMDWGTRQIQSKANSNLCVLGQATTVQVVQYTCTSYRDQWWYLTDVVS